jgi:hypothetical protein
LIAFTPEAAQRVIDLRQHSRPGRAWIKSARYWIAYNTAQPPVIVGVFFDAADIPRRA